MAQIISPPRYNIQNAPDRKIGQSYETCKRAFMFLHEVLPCALRNKFLNFQQNLKKNWNLSKTIGEFYRTSTIKRFAVKINATVL